MILFDLFMILSPPLAFLEQYKIIRSSRSLGSFSTLTCAILLISNIMRVFYWVAIGFAIPLLLQSMLMIIAQLALLKLCVEVQKPSTGGKFDMRHFWRWSKFQHYGIFLLGLTTSLTLTTTILKFTPLGKPYGEAIGFISMMIEACLGMPQLIKNLRHKSVKGLSYVMIICWFLGDGFKTVYFILEKQPAQFLMCGIIQLTVDVLILMQMFFYKNNSHAQVPYDDGKEEHQL